MTAKGRRRRRAIDGRRPHGTLLRSVQDGVYYTYGASPEYSSIKLEEFNHFRELMRGGDKDGQTLTYGEVAGLGCAERDLCMRTLVVIHEREHYLQHTTTIFGLLVWRIMQCLRSDICRITEQIDRTANFDGIYAPVQDWARKNGARHFDEHPPIHSKFYEAYAREGKAEYWLAAERQILVTCCDEIDVFVRFFELMMGRADGDLIESVTLANTAMAMLAERSGLNDTIEFSQPAVEPARHRGYNLYSTEEVLEAGARISELFTLHIFGADADMISTWRSRYIHGVYARVFELLESRIVSLSSDPRVGLLIAKGVVDLALCAPLDPVCAHATLRSIDFLEVHPGALIPRLAEAAHRVLIRRDSNEKRDLDSVTEFGVVTLLQDEICREAGVALSAKVLRAASQGIIQDGANWAGARLEVAVDEPDEGWSGSNTPMGLLRIVRERSDNRPVGGFVSMSEAVFHSSFRERAERPDLFAEPCAAGAVIPLVEYFADASALNPPGSLTEDALDGRPAPNHLTSFLNIAEHLIALSVAGFGTHKEATRLDEKMRLRMRWMLEDDTGDKAADLRATSLIPSVVMPFLPRAAGILWQQVTADG